jgi:protein-tyrosine phosphatase
VTLSHSSPAAFDFGQSMESLPLPRMGDFICCRPPFPAHLPAEILWGLPTRSSDKKMSKEQFHVELADYGVRMVANDLVLFLCSGNYYRSRFAEHFFNWLAESNGLSWRADSRGLVVGRAGNAGPISCHAVERLHALNIPINGDSRFPKQLSEADLSQAKLIVALKEAEHRQMLFDLFPAWAERVEYWHIDDLDCAEPDEALASLENDVQRLVQRLVS